MADNKDQKNQVQEKNNTDLASRITTGVGGNLKKGFTGMNKTLTGLFSKNAEQISEGKRATKIKIKNDKEMLVRLTGIFKMSKSQKIASDAARSAAETAGNNWKLLLGLGLFMMPKEYWTKLKDVFFEIIDWLGEVNWEETWKTLKNIFKGTFVILEKVLNGIWMVLEPMLGMIFGKREEGKEGLQGGLFGEGGGIIDKFLGGLSLATLAFGVFAPGAAFSLAIWGFKKTIGALTVSLGKSALGGATNMLRDRSAVSSMTPEQIQMSNDRAANAKKVGPGAGKTPSKTGGSWYKKLLSKMGKFGTAIARLGQGVVTGLMTMGPWGWGILLGIGLGLFVYAYWDDWVKSFKEISAGISKGIDKITGFVGGIVDGAQEIVGNFLRSVGAGMIADWIDPKNADPENPTEFTWGGFAGELWAIYSGIWGKIFDFLKFTDLRSKLAGWMRDNGAGIFANWIEPDKDKKTEEEVTPLNIMKEYSILMKEVWTKIANLIRKINPIEIAKNVTKKFKEGAEALWEDIKSSLPGSSKPETETPETNKPETNKPETNKPETETPKPKAKAKPKGGGMLGKVGNFFGKLKTSITGSKSTEGESGTIPDDGGTTDMSGVKWNKMSPEGRKGVESVIWSIYNKHGKKPMFVSGLRGKGHPLYNPNSKHAYGMGFDLRSKELGDKKGAIAADLASTFGQKGWFMQEEVSGQSNSTGTRATGDHFHIHKAAKGFHGWVNEATGFIAGEAGRERVDITPITNPQSRTNAMNDLHRENAEGKMTSNAAPVIVSSPTTTTVSNNTQPLVMSPTAKSPVPL